MIFHLESSRLGFEYKYIGFQKIADVTADSPLLITHSLVNLICPEGIGLLSEVILHTSKAHY